MEEVMNHPSLYEFSIGDMGNWLDKLSDLEVTEIKSLLRVELLTALANVDSLWSVDLGTLALLNGLDPTPTTHLALPIEVHRSTVRSWLTNVNRMLLSTQQLWIADDSTLEFRCCTTKANGEWHTCGALPLLIGANQASATRWEFHATLQRDGASLEVVVPIYLQVTWTCLIEHQELQAQGSNGHTPSVRRKAAAERPSRKTDARKPTPRE